VILPLLQAQLSSKLLVQELLLDLLLLEEVQGLFLLGVDYVVFG